MLDECSYFSSRQPQQGQEPTSGRDDPKTTIDHRSVFRDPPPSQDEGQEEVVVNGLENGRSSQGSEGSIDRLGNYPLDTKEELEGVGLWSRNGASAVHDVVEVVKDEALAPPTAASAAPPPVATHSDDDAVLQAIIVGKYMHGVLFSMASRRRHNFLKINISSNYFTCIASDACLCTV